MILVTLSHFIYYMKKSLCSRWTKRVRPEEARIIVNYITTNSGDVDYIRTYSDGVANFD